MKYFQLTFLVFLITQNLFALTSGFNFQAVLRDAEGNILANEDVEITISLLSLDGKEVYSETHTSQTNATGLMSLVIGEGTSDINFSNIDWSQKYGLEIKVNGEQFSAQQLNSVPYALYSENGLTPEQASAITANTAKAGITSEQAAAIIANTAKTGITADQATAIVANSQNIFFDTLGNTAVGYVALVSNASGAKNTVLGSGSMYVNREGEGNTAIGQLTLPSNTSGDNNTAVGNEAGYTLTTGQNNVLIGALSKTSSVDSENQIVIGTGAVGQADNTVTLGNSSVTDIYAAEDGEAIIHAGGITFSDGTTQTTASSSDGGSGGGTSSSNVTFNQVLTSGFTDSTTVLEIGNFTIRVKSIDNSNHYLEWKVNTGDISDYFAATVTMKGSRAADWNAMNVEPVVGNNSGIRAEDTFTEIVDRNNNYTGGESGGYLNSPGLWYYKTVEVELTNEQHNESYKITAIVNGLGKVMLKGEHWDFK